MTCHAVEHALSGYYDVTHGEGLAALLPAWMRHFYRADNPASILSARMSSAKKTGSKPPNSSSRALECGCALAI